MKPLRRLATKLGTLSMTVMVILALSVSLLIIFQFLFSPFHVVRSNSMSPNICTDDAIIIKDIDPSEIEVGNVVIFRDPDRSGNLIVHRVVGLENEGEKTYLTTRGDANPVEDPFRVKTQAVIGSVALKIPKFGAFLDFVQSPRGFTCLVIIPVAIFLLLVLSQGFRRRRRPQEPDLEARTTTTM